MHSFAHIAILVRDLDSMEEFYQEIFDMRTVWRREGEKAYLTTGGCDILGLLVDPAATPGTFSLAEITAESKTTPNFFHFGLVTTEAETFDRVLQRVRDRSMIVAGPKVSRDTTRSFYFHDPEGHNLQVVQVPTNYFGSE